MYLNLAKMWHLCDKTFHRNDKHVTDQYGHQITTREKNK